MPCALLFFFSYGNVWLYKFLFCKGALYLTLNKKILSLLTVLIIIIGCGSIPPYVREDLSVLDEFQFADDIDHFVFYSPHQDDETIFFAQTIQAAVAQVGSDHVSVVLLSDGAASNVQNMPEIETPLRTIVDSVQQCFSDTPLTEDELSAAKRLLFSKARTNEFLAALDAQGIAHYEIHSLPDGDLENHLGDIENIIRSKCGTEGLTAHLTYSYYFDPHSDHRTLGYALQNVSQDAGFADHNVAYCMVKMEPSTLSEFYDTRLHYKKAHFRLLQDTSAYDHIAAASAEYGVRCQDMDAVTQQIAQDLFDTMQRKNCSLLQAIETTPSVSALRLSVGHLSVPDFFSMVDRHLSETTLVTLIHTPF